MKKVLCLIDSLGAGGAQRQMVGLATFLKSKGYDVTLAAYHNEDFYNSLLTDGNVPFVYLKNAESAICRVPVIFDFIRKRKPDYVISYLRSTSEIACICKLLYRKFKLIVSERNTDTSVTINERIRFNLFRLADYIVPNAFSQAKYIEQHFPFLNNKVHTISNFVDLQNFSPANHIRRKDPLILVVASIRPSKNTLVFIRAVDILKKKGVNLRIEWYGKSVEFDDYFNKCLSEIKELGLCDYISLLDKTQNISEKYRTSDYFCLPSLFEGTPNVICEAISSGLPIICSDVCDNKIYVQNNYNGFLFNPLDPIDIADKIYTAINISDDTYYDYCKNSRTIAEEKLSKEKFIESYMNLLY